MFNKGGVIRTYYRAATNCNFINFLSHSQYRMTQTENVCFLKIFEIFDDTDNEFY